MTIQQAKEKFDNIKDFKEKFLFWEKHKNLIQQSFTELQNELEKIREICSPKIKIDFNGVLSKGAKFGILSKEEILIEFRQGEILRELESINPIPDNEEDKAFVVKYRIESYRVHLDKTFPILTFEEFKAEFGKEVEKKPKGIYINFQLENLREYLLNKTFLCEKTILFNGQKKRLDNYINANLNNECEIDLSLFYDDVKNDWNSITISLAYLLSPIQYIRFLEVEKEKLTSIPTNQENDGNSTNSTTQGYDLGLTTPQLETLHAELVINEFLNPKTELEHFKNAFNGQVWNNDFKPLEWIEPTKGAVFLYYFSQGNKPKWKKIENSFNPANYKQLLSQSRGNGTFETLKKELEKIIL